MENVLYWLWLTVDKRISDGEMTALMNKFKSAKAIYQIEDTEEIAGFSKNTKRAVTDKSLEKARNVLAKIERLGGYILTYDDEDYPPLLRNIYAPPYVLYLMGERIDWNKMLTITVVGTRECNDYGVRATEHIAEDLAKSGVTVVSGMARGVDAVAGMTAVKSGGKTVAVLGSGIDVIYPPEHGQVYDLIRKNGVVMTEYPPGTPPNRENFPRRNRIMAGLSYGILVVQAPKKSGALITASWGIDNGRDIFAVPADIFDKKSEGSNRLLNQGAKAVLCAEDITEEYPYIPLTPPNDKTESEPQKKNKSEDLDLSGLNTLQQRIVKLLSDKSMHVDEISRELEIESFELNSEMVMLELDGIVKKRNGNIYELS